MSKKVIYFCLALFGGMLFGYDTAVINGAMPFFTAFFNLSDAMVGWAVSSGLVGCIFGALVASRPADKLGRRDSMKVVSLIFLLSALATGLAPNLSVFILGRILGGIAVGAVSVILPIYISEISRAEERGSATINFQLGVVVGILLAFFIDYLLIDTGEYNWRYMFLSMAIPSIMFYIFLCKAARSPRWLIKQNLKEEAKLAVLESYTKEESKQIIKEIEESIEREKKSRSDKKPNLLKKPNLKFILIGIGVGLFSQFTGIAIVMYYATDIFRAAGFSTDAAIGQTVIIGITNLTFTLLAKNLIDKIGRRKLLLFGTMGMSITLAVLTFSFISPVLPGWVLLLALICFVALFASSMGAVSWVLLGEMFPNSIRTQGMSIGSLTNWCVNGTISFLFPIVVSSFKLGSAYTFASFSIITFVGYLFFKKYLFETTNKTLEEIENENTEQ